MGRPHLLVLLLAGLALVLPPLASADVDCYFGVTQEGDDDPEEDWDADCDAETTEGCKVTCEGDNAACFKVRYGEIPGHIF